MVTKIFGGIEVEIITENVEVFQSYENVYDRTCEINHGLEVYLKKYSFRKKHKEKIEDSKNGLETKM